MKKSIYSNTDSFSQAPLLSLLPTLGDLVSLKKLNSSFFARLERVVALRADLGADAPKETSRRLVMEEALLKQVLDWTEVG